MRAVVYNTHILVEGGSQEFDERLEDDFTITVYAAHRDPVEKSLVKCTSAGVLVPRGLLPKLKRFLENEGANVTWVDARSKVPPPDISRLGLAKPPLYPHQREACEKLLSLDMGIMDATTSAGKGNMIPALSMCFPDLRVGIFTKSTSLVKDLEQRIPKITGEAAGVLAAHRQEIGRVTVIGADWISSQVKSKTKYAAYLAKLDVIIVDECHEWATDLKCRVLEACTGARYRYGLSGTSLKRSDGRTPVMVGNVGPVTSKLTYRDLADVGVIAKATVKMVLFRHTNPQDRRTYVDFYAANIYNNKARNDLVFQIAEMSEFPVIIFVERTQHVILLEKYARIRKYDVEVVYGKTPQPIRDRAIANAANGTLDMLIGSRVLFTGSNMPALRSGVLADAGRSAIKVLQKAGRLMRRTSDKHEFTLYDVCDIWPVRKSDGGPAAFEAQARARYVEYVKAGFSVEFVEFVDGQVRATKPPFSYRGGLHG